MTILHLLSQNHLTGAEVYACHLADIQTEQHHRVYQASNGFYYPTHAEQLQLEVETHSKITFLKSVLKLREFIKQHNVQVVHAHSRAASKLAHYATRGLFGFGRLKVGYVSSIHGRQHYSLSKRLTNIYGDYQIPVCENISQQLINEFKYKPEHIKVIRNGISQQLYSTKKINSLPTPSDLLKIAIIGRATGPKKTRTEEFIKGFIPLLQDKGIQYELHLIGAESSDFSQDFVNQYLKDHVNFYKTSSLNSSIYNQFNLIVGSGRVCMESLMSGVPTIAFGEASYLGLCTPTKLSDFLKSNFGDIAENSFGAPIFNPHLASDDIEAYYKLTVSALLDLSQKAKTEFSVTAIAKKILKIYEASYFKAHYSKWIPVLMYHKIPDSELNSPHKIFVTKDKFSQHLDFFKQRGLKTLTFGDLKKYKSGELSFKNFPKKPLILTFDDGYMDNLKNADPLLKKYDFKAQIFLLANSSISHNQWDEVDKNKGDQIISGEDRKMWLQSSFEIGSHGFSHRKITEMSDSEAFHELHESKRSLEKEFNREIGVYAYTYGDTSAKAAKLAEEAGYDFAVNTDTGGMNLFDDPYQIFRVNIFPDETKISLWKKTSPWYRNYYFKKRKK
ncbi:MAG: polysaccharide deacetylase family protein [Pseudobdellovibrio sp.]